MEDTTRAYIAGLFDGEGYAGREVYKATKNGRKYARLRAVITNTDEDVIAWLLNFLGYGSIIVDRRNPRVCYRYQVQGSKAREFLMTIRPWLRIKAGTVDGLLKQKTFGRVA